MSKNRTLLSRPSELTIGAMIALTGLAVSVASAGAPAPVVSGEIATISMRGKPAVLQIENPGATLSFAHGPSVRFGSRVLLSNKVVVRTEDPAALRSYAASVGAVVEQRLGKTNAWVVGLADVRGAVRFAEGAGAQDWALSAEVDQGIVPDYATIKDSTAKHLKAAGLADLEGGRSYRPVGNAVDSWGGQSPAGGADPLEPTLFHHVNSGIGTFRHDNNIPSSVYDTDMATGAGVTIGMARYTFTNHIDRDHDDFENNFDSVLTMPVDLTLEPDSVGLTRLAGLMVAERGNGIGAHGVAPGANLAGLTYGTNLQIYNMFAHRNNDIDVKFIPMNQEFIGSANGSFYNEGFGGDYVRDSFENALRFGRGRKGQVFVFSGGNNGVWFLDPAFPPQTPDFYTGNGIADLYTAGNMVEIWTADDGGGMYLDGPFHIRAQAAFWPFANDRRTFLINAVDEDLVPDIHQAFGPGVFASVISSTSNLTAYLDAGPPPAGFARGVTVTEPGDGYAPFADPINFPEEGNYFIASQSSGAIGAGIIALLLDVNPGLTIRDIQHILFESIFESTRDPAITFPTLDTSTQIYMTPPPVGYGGDGTEQSTWQANAALLDSPTGPRAVRHSDFYGFGIIDTELAVQKAASWSGTPRLFLLDTGLVGDVGGDDGGGGMDDENETRVPVDIADAEFIMQGESAAQLNFGGRFIDAGNQIAVCVRNNIQLETIVVELTIEGNSHNDLWIELESPNGTRSNLLLPVTQNYAGTTFDEDLSDDNADNGAFTAGFVGTTEYALYRHEFTTFKHWGELAGGRWAINFYDYGADDEMEEGDGMSDDDAVPFVTTLGPFGVPGSSFRDDKTVTAFRIKFYGTETGQPIFAGCDPFETSCPGDLNGDGVVDSADMNTFIAWYLAGDARADINDSGDIDFLDLTFWIGTFTPGFCSSGGGGGNPFIGNRPTPGGTNSDDNNPVTRPV